MGIKIHPLVDQAKSLVQEVQAAETTAETHVICESTRDRLFHKLERNQDNLNALREKILAEAVDEFDRAQIDDAIEGLDQRIIRLYGRIQSSFIDTKVAAIADEAKDLETKLADGDVDKISSAFSHLDAHIQTFIDNHRLLREARHTMADVRATRQKAYSYLRTHGLREIPHLINQFNLLELAPPPTARLEDDEIQVELVMEIYSVAKLFFQKEAQEGLQRFNRLDGEAKRRFHLHLANLGEPSGDPMADRIKTTQALIAAAYDLADSHDGEPYLAEHQLIELFSNDCPFS